MIKNLSNETELSGLYFIYKGSTNLEKKGWYGISHMLEHIKCRCFEDLQDDLQANGISWNAYTSDNIIVFYFTGLEEYLAPFRDTLIERMYLPFQNYVDVSIIENEKQIILEEYQDSFTNQNDIFFMNLFRKKFNHYSPIGLKEDIENFTIEDCKEFFELQYNKPDMIINISKSFVLDKDLEFEDRSNTMKSDFVENLNAELEIRGEFPESLCLYYYREIEEKDIPFVKLISSMLGSGLNSPLYQEIREKKALCYHVGGCVYDIGKMPLMLITILTSPTKSNIVHETLDEIMSNKEKYLTQNRLDIIKKAMIISKKKKLINRYEYITDIIDTNVSILNSILETVTLDDIYKIYDKYFNIDSFTKVDDKNY
jgi:predicted Zn-dependent peptidase